jgi:hypothetical protein
VHPAASSWVYFTLLLSCCSIYLRHVRSSLSTIRLVIKCSIKSSQLFIVPSNQFNFSVIQTLQCLSVPSNHLTCHDSNFVVSQCPVKSSRLFSNLDFAVSQCAIKSAQLFCDSELEVIKYAFK